MDANKLFARHPGKFGLPGWAHEIEQRTGVPPIAGGVDMKRPYEIGSSSITIDGSSAFASVNVPHGLGEDPEHAFVTITQGMSGAFIIQFGLTGHDATNLNVAAVVVNVPVGGGNLVLTPPGAPDIPADIGFDWLAFGAEVPA